MMIYLARYVKMHQVKNTYSKYLSSIRSMGALFSSGILGLIISFLVGLIQSRYISPSVLGKYSSYTIIPMYMSFMQLGVITSLGWRYPQLLGSGLVDDARRYVATTQGWVIIVCFIEILILTSCSIASLVHNDYKGAAGWLCQAVIAPATMGMLYLSATYRANSEFVVWSRCNLIGSMASFIILPVSIVLQYWGLCIKYSFQSVIQCLALVISRPVKVKSHIERSVLYDLIRYGFGIMVLYYLRYQGWDAILMTIISKVGGVKSLGEYTFALNMCSILSIFGSSISQVFHPKMAAEYGRTGSRSVSFKYTLKVSILSTGLMIIVVLIFNALIGPFVRTFIPKYVNSLTIVGISCWSSLNIVMDLPKHLLAIWGEQVAYGKTIGLCFLVYLLGIWFCLNSHTYRNVGSLVAISVICKFIEVVSSNYMAWRYSR